jgi:protein-S-isoprenylcysteine O-methyltransferase Ste14
MKINSKDFFLVGIQLVLFVLYTVPVEWSLEFFSWFKTIGWIVASVGLLIVVIALLQLNSNLSPFPTPKDNAVLIQNGLYAWVRHPIYTGVLLLFLGYGIYLASLNKLLITFLLWLLFYFKTQYEEIQLQKKFPKYGLFKASRGRFFPKLGGKFH